VALHDDLLLGLVENLKPLVEKGRSLGFEFLLGRCDLHCWPVVSNFSGYRQ
jgi:hypothetical protein